MPLSFESTSHGAVAFGFFNIDVDLLLLERSLFHAAGFTRAVETLAAAEPDRSVTLHIDGHRATDASHMGNTMGAIHGFDRGGLIGAIYDRFPFPIDPAAFRQHPDGAARRDAIAPLLERWTTPTRHRLAVAIEGRTVELAGIEFTWPWFQELVAYVWRGGYPRWLDERRPDHVVRMRRAVEGSGHPLFAGQEWELRRVRT